MIQMTRYPCYSVGIPENSWRTYETQEGESVRPLSAVPNPFRR